MDGSPTALLVPDAALATPVAEAILADINTLLNAGDVLGEQNGAHANAQLACVLACSGVHPCTAAASLYRPRAKRNSPPPACRHVD